MNCPDDFNLTVLDGYLIVWLGYTLTRHPTHSDNFATERSDSFNPTEVSGCRSVSHLE
jgi:hypothetical protein